MRSFAWSAVQVPGSVHGPSGAWSQLVGHSASTSPFSCSSHFWKNALNAVRTDPDSGVMVGIVSPVVLPGLGTRGDGRISSRTLSPVPVGLVWVAGKWMLPVLDPWKQSGKVSPGWNGGAAPGYG